MTINRSQRAGFAAELLLTLPNDSSWHAFGPLLAPPVQIIFDNQGTVAVAISADGGATTWRTFPAGEAIVLDMRANHGIADNFTISLGTTFYAKGAQGTFSISYVYAIVQSGN